jgi:serine/threonine protein phosphatase PrpC
MIGCTGRSPMNTDHLDTRLPFTVHVSAPATTVPQATLRIAARSDPGRVRANNEDRYLTVRFDRSTTPIGTNLDPRQLKFVRSQTAWALAVADGMGGHAAGEVASTLALTLALKLSQQGSRWYVEIGDAEAREIVGRVESILASIDRAIAEESEHEAGLAGMGTTLTVACVMGDRLFAYNVGDSRAYLQRRGRLRRLTRDQTMTRELVDAGLIPPELEATHHMRHVLTQAMGMGNVIVEVHQLHLEHGDRLLLASDGLTDGVSDAEIEEMLGRDDADVAADRLLDKALAAGGRDNITVIVADVEIADQT